METAVYETLLDPRQTSWCEHRFCKINLFLVYTYSAVPASCTHPLPKKLGSGFVILFDSFLWTSWTNIEDVYNPEEHTTLGAPTLSNEPQLAELTISIFVNQTHGPWQWSLYCVLHEGFQATDDIDDVTTDTLVSTFYPADPSCVATYNVARVEAHFSGHIHDLYPNLWTETHFDSGMFIISIIWFFVILAYAKSEKQHWKLTVKVTGLLVSLFINKEKHLMMLEWCSTVIRLCLRPTALPCHAPLF